MHLHRRRGLGRILLTEETDHALEDGEVQLAVAVDVGDLHEGDLAVGVLDHHDQVEDPDEAPLLEIQQVGSHRAGRWA